MSITWQEIHNQVHSYRTGEVAIDQAFTGNVLSVQVETKPEYDLSRQVVGWLYQYSGLAIKKFALISGNDVLFLALPETDRLEFIPTPYLNESYALTINAATIDGASGSGVSGSIPDAILGLPDRVLAVENGLAGATSLLTNLQTSLDGKAATAHNHAIADVTNLQTSLDGKAATAHNHAIADVTALQTSLDGKSNTGHNHTIADVTALQTSLDGKSNAGHNHAIADVTALQTSLDGKAAQSDLTSLTSRVSSLESGDVSTFPKKVKINGTGNRGLFWYLGTLGTDENFTDPITRGSVFGLMSSAIGGTLPQNLLNRVSLVASTDTIANSWIGFDIGLNRSLLLDKYFLRSRQDSNGNHLKTWTLEGTNSVNANTVAGFNAASWTAIDSQSNSSLLVGLGLSAFFVATKDLYFRYFRIRQTGTDSGGSNYLTLSAIEFFGVLKLTS